MSGGSGLSPNEMEGRNAAHSAAVFSLPETGRYNQIGKARCTHNGGVLLQVQGKTRDFQPGAGNTQERPAGDARSLSSMRDQGIPDR